MYVCSNTAFTQTCTCTNPVAGIFCPPVTPDNPTNAVPTGVQNTGNDAISRLYVMVWDEANYPYGRYAWDNTAGLKGTGPILGSIGGTNVISDPDVIVYHDPLIGPNPLVVIVYIDNSSIPARQVYYNVYYSTLTGFTQIVTGQILSISANGPCNNPNIDVAESGQQVGGIPNSGLVVFTWEQDDKIYTNATNLPSSLGTSLIFTPSPIIYNGQVNNTKPSLPDVAVNVNSNFTNPRCSFNPNQVVSYVFINDHLTYRQLDVLQYDLTSIATGSLFLLNSFNNLYPANLSVNEILGPPRIACPLHAPVFCGGDFEVVIKHNDPNTGTGDMIEGFNLANGSPTIMGPTLLNGPLTGCNLSEKPVVTYVGDFIIAAWTFEDATSPVPCSYFDNYKEVIARRLCGNVCGTAPGQPNDGCYSIVNVNMELDQYEPSIARVKDIYNNPGNAFCLYTFYDNRPGMVDIWYKTSLFTNMNLKHRENSVSEIKTPKKEESELQIYPNPFDEDVTITFTLSNDEEADHIYVYDATGIQICKIDISGYTEGEHSVTWKSSDEQKSLQQGVYLVKLITNKYIKTAKFSRIK